LVRNRPRFRMLSNLFQFLRRLMSRRQSSNDSHKRKESRNRARYLEWLRARFHLAHKDKLDLEAEAEPLDKAMLEDYQLLLQHQGWRRYEQEVEAQATRAVMNLMSTRPLLGEDLRDFAVRVVQTQEYVASCYNALAIPRNYIELAEENESA
jgi:hypothetical protein